MLNGYDVIAAVLHPHAVPHEELQVALVLGVGVSVDVHHDRVGPPAPQVRQLAGAVPVAALRGM